MATNTDLATGIVTVILFFAFGLAVIARLLSGRFLVPKREVVLPNQRGVIVQTDQVVRVVEPGPCWVRPRQRIVLVDMRPRPLQLAGFEVLGSDNRVVRLSMSGEYKIADPAVYYQNSTNAADALYVQLRRAINILARQQPGSSLAAKPAVFGAHVMRELVETTQRLGLAIVQVDFYEVVPLAFINVPAEANLPSSISGLVH